MENRATRNAIFMMRFMAERSFEIHRYLYICFIDKKKDFDKVRYTKLISILNYLDIDVKDLRLIQDLYWRQQAAFKIENDLSKYVEIELGVRKRCVLSLEQFYLRYADDTALIA